MSVITSKILASGVVPPVTGSLYTVPPATNAYVKFFSIYNTSPLTEIVEIFVQPNGGVIRKIGQSQLLENEFVYVIGKDDSLTLGPGDSILGDSLNAFSCDYLITGGEEV